MLRVQHAHDDSLILDELGLSQGDVRVDVAVVNGSLSGYEIKSSSDTLKRLPRQQELYSQVLDHAWLVAPADKLGESAAIVPEWWGLIEISGPTLTLNIRRSASINPDPAPTMIAALLWREEALTLLEKHGGAGTLRSKPRRALWAALAERLALPELQDAVRTTLKIRPPDWRVRERHRLSGARSRSVSTSPRFLGSQLRPHIPECSGHQD